MKLTYEAHWTHSAACCDHVTRKLRIGPYRADCHPVKTVGGYAWSAYYRDEHMIGIGHEDDEGDALDAAEKAIRNHADPQGD